MPSKPPSTAFNNTREFCQHVSGVFTPVLAKHTKSFNLIDTLSVGVDRIQRNFEPLRRQVEVWRRTQITDDTANTFGVHSKSKQSRGARLSSPDFLPTASFRRHSPRVGRRAHVDTDNFRKGLIEGKLHADLACSELAICRHNILV